jgi:hypothetical protein
MYSIQIGFWEIRRSYFCSKQSIKTEKLFGLRPIRQLLIATIICLFFVGNVNAQWKSQWAYYNQQGKLLYKADKKGNIIPDFSKVGYRKGEMPPVVNVVETVSSEPGDDYLRIQNAIEKVEEMPLNINGFRGCVLLKKGKYQISQELKITKSGIVIRGEGDSETGTVLIATEATQYNLLSVRGSGSWNEIKGTRTKIAQSYVPVGTKELTLASAQGYSVGDKVIVFRPGSAQWIHDLKMDRIVPRSDGNQIKQWSPKKYNTSFDRVVEKISGNKIVIDQPIVMPMEDKYGGGFVYQFTFDTRISNCGVENILMKSSFTSETDENHAWTAITIDKAENCWIKDITTKYFGYSLVTINKRAKYISVLNCKCFDPKSIITGGRRYSFNINGQMCLVSECESKGGRHDFTQGGSKVAGPNVFTRCRATETHADCGPHQRWSMGALYDMIESTGDINVQDRGNWGSGHGWAGVTYILWNCKARKICVQNPWVTGNNYCIACRAQKSNGKLPDRPNGIWEGQREINLEIESLYEAQIQARQNSTPASVYACNKKSVGNNLRVYPNPFAIGTQIKFNLNENSEVTLTVYSSTERLIQTLLNCKLKMGIHSANFDGIGLPPGLYIYKLNVNNKITNGKIVKQ